jgi:hypothetical protein
MSSSIHYGKLLSIGYTAIVNSLKLAHFNEDAPIDFLDIINDATRSVMSILSLYAQPELEFDDDSLMEIANDTVKYRFSMQDNFRGWTSEVVNDDDGNSSNSIAESTAVATTTINTTDP